MESNIGKLTATLSNAEKNKIKNLVDILNTNIKPSVMLTSEDIHVRCMFIVSEELNSYGGKFPLEELHRIKELIIDSPVLIGHKKDQLPIGRNFYAEVVFKDNTHWVKSYFYWLKSAENADDLQKNIDGGIIKECSIGFTFLTPECSICKSDIRTCRHEPFGNYVINGLTQSCYFYYQQIENVLETSLVYRGANPNTSISNELLKEDGNSNIPVINNINSLDVLNEQAFYLITPRYIGLDILLTTTQNSIQVKSLDNLLLPKQLLKKYFREYPKNLINQYGKIIGFRGKERCPLDELQKFIAGEKSIVKRIELRLFPSYNILKSNYQNIQVMRYKIARKNEINKLSQTIMTKDGIHLCSLHELLPMHNGYLYQTGNIFQEDNENTYLYTYDSQKNVILSLITDCNEFHFLVKRFTPNGLSFGKKFLAERIEKDNTNQIQKTKYNSGRLLMISDMNKSLQLELKGLLNSRVTIQPILINGKDRYLLYKTV